MNAGVSMGSLWFRLVCAVARLWIRPAVLPETIRTHFAASDEPVCYVLEYGGLADRIALQLAAARLELPVPGAGLHFAGHSEPRAIIRIRSPAGWFSRRPGTELSPRLGRLVEAGMREAGSELRCFPVAVYWGRSPEKERGFWRIAFSERWALVGRGRRFLATLIHGRNTLVQFSEPLSLSAILNEKLPTERTVRKVSRILRVHFRNRRIAALGPDLSHRRTLVERVLRDDDVRAVIRQKGGANPAIQARLTDEARDYAREIAADFSYPTVRVLERLLARIWTRLYDGVHLAGTGRLHSVVAGNGVVYVPCHRSHMDYLLLSYIIYHEGLSIPHVAAGINLNLPVIGSLLRRGGAFFLRRSFRGNRLYAQVFHAYLKQLQSSGFSLEYFIEGGRSRTGRLLSPKGGMLSMTVASYIDEPERPVVFVPVYFGYEKLLESRSFVSELEGGEKPRESLWALLRSLRKLRENFGQVYVNFGDPIDLERFIATRAADWRAAPTGLTNDDATRPDWFGVVIDELGEEIMLRINRAAAVTPVALVALAILGTPRQTIAESDLERQIELMLELLEAVPYAPETELPDMSPPEMIEHCIHLGLIAREPHPLGDLVSAAEPDAVQMTYFRNNILHLLAVPASIASAFTGGRECTGEELLRLVRLSFPFITAELTMDADGIDLPAQVDAYVAFMRDRGLLIEASGSGALRAPPGGTHTAFELHLLGQAIVPVLQRYYLTIALLLRSGSATVTATELERAAELCAQRLSMTYGLRSPDFFDRELFRNFIRGLRKAGTLTNGENSTLTYDDALERVQVDARRLLGPEIHHSILSVTAVDDGTQTDGD